MLLLTNNVRLVKIGQDRRRPGETESVTFHSGYKHGGQEAVCPDI